jgi:hypothetical protein
MNDRLQWIQYMLMTWFLSTGYFQEVFSGQDCLAPGYKHPGVTSSEAIVCPYLLPYTVRTIYR